MLQLCEDGYDDVLLQMVFSLHKGHEQLIRVIQMKYTAAFVFENENVYFAP